MLLHWKFVLLLLPALAFGQAPAIENYTLSDVTDLQLRVGPQTMQVVVFGANLGGAGAAIMINGVAIPTTSRVSNGRAYLVGSISPGTPAGSAIRSGSFTIAARTPSGTSAALTVSNVLVPVIDSATYLGPIASRPGFVGIRLQGRNFGTTRPWHMAQCSGFGSRSLPDARLQTSTSAELDIPTNCTSPVVVAAWGPILYFNGLVGAELVSDGVSVNLQAQPPATAISASPLTLNLAQPAAGGPVSATVQLTTANNTPVSFTTRSDAAWLTVQPSTGTAPAALTITANPAGLSGTQTSYTGAITVSGSSGGTPVTIAVTFTLSPVTPPASSITPVPAQLTLTQPASGGVTSATVRLTTPNDMPVSFTARASVAWLSVQPPSGTAPATLTVVADGSGLQGTQTVYTGAIAITIAGVTAPLTIPVTYTLNQTLSIRALPESLEFGAVLGRNSNASRTLEISGSRVGIGFTASASSSGWLSLRPDRGSTPVSVQVEAATAGLSAGRYEGAVTISSALIPDSSIRIPVVLTVGSPPGITTFPEALSFLFRQGEAAPPAQQVSIFSTGSSVPVAYSASSGAPQWLNATPTVGSTPASLAVRVSPGSLPPGTYESTIAIATPDATPASRTVPVRLLVQAEERPTLAAGIPELNSQLGPGGEQAFSVPIGNAGGGTLSFSARFEGSFGTLGLTSGQLGARASIAIPLLLRAGALTGGTYRGTMIVAAAGSTPPEVRVPVTLIVTSRPAVIAASASALEFVAAEGGGATPPQRLAVLNLGTGNLSWTARATTFQPGTSWLRISAAAGTSAGGGGGATPLSVSVDSGSLPAGRYAGRIDFLAPAAANVQESVTVYLTVLRRGQNPGLIFDPPGLIFISAAGAPDPGAATVNIRNPGEATTFSAVVSTEDGQSWLSVSPSSVQLSAGGSTSVRVQVRLSELAPGVRRGAIRLATQDGGVHVISVAAGVFAGAVSALAKSGVAAMPGCDALVLNLERPTAGLRLTAGIPITITAAARNSCDQAVTSGLTISGSVANLDVPQNDARRTLATLKFLPLDGGRFEATWTPAGAVARAAVSVTSFLVTASQTSGDQVERLVAVIAAPADAPALILGTANSASFLEAGKVAPGTSVAILGERLSPAEALPAAGPLPTRLGEVSVQLGSQLLPLQYAGPAQINALIPLTAEPSNTKISVIRGNQTSAPADLSVLNAIPAIYATNLAGTGQGAITIANTGVIAAPSGAFPGSRPVRRGEFLEIYCTGLGEVTNPPPDGAPAAVIPPLAETVQRPVVEIGGVAADVVFAGLGPGLRGIYQVNVRVPQGAPSGGAVNLRMRVGDSTSNVVTIAVQP